MQKFNLNKSASTYAQKTTKHFLHQHFQKISTYKN